MATGRTRLLVSPFSLFSCSNLTRSCHSVEGFLQRRQNCSVGTETEQSRKENYRRRVDLAAAYRGFEKYAFHEGVCNHLSMIAPARNGQGEVMLITPYGFHWSEVKASTLVGLNEKSELVEGTGEVEITAANIHWGLHKARPDATCVFHLHPPYCTALAPSIVAEVEMSNTTSMARLVCVSKAALKMKEIDECGLLVGTLRNPQLGMYHQNSCLFYNRIAYDREYSGLSVEEEEGVRIAKQLGNKSVLFMCNHGVLVTGNCAARAFDDMYYLERACMTQVLAMSTGHERFEIPDDVARLANQQLDGPGEREKYYEAHFNSLKRRLARECPDYMD